MVILQVGLQPFFAFVPADWGGINEDGDWVSKREQWSGLLAIILTVIVFVYVERSQKLKIQADQNTKKTDEDL
jgi:hypothetical protein